MATYTASCNTSSDSMVKGQVLDEQDKMLAGKHIRHTVARKTWTKVSFCDGNHPTYVLFFHTNPTRHVDTKSLQGGGAGICSVSILVTLFALVSERQHEQLPESAIVTLVSHLS